MFFFRGLGGRSTSFSISWTPAAVGTYNLSADAQGGSLGCTGNDNCSFNGGSDSNCFVSYGRTWSSCGPNALFDVTITDSTRETRSTSTAIQPNPLTCTAITADAPLGKTSSGQDVYIVTEKTSIDLTANVSPSGTVVTWKPVGTGVTLSSLSGDATTLTASTNGTFSVGASVKSGSSTASCPDITVTFQPAQATVIPTRSTASVNTQNLRHDGDVNSDSKFDLADMSALLAQFNQSGQSEADLTSDGVVNSFDVLKLRGILVQKGVLGGGQ